MVLHVVRRSLRHLIPESLGHDVQREIDAGGQPAGGVDVVCGPHVPFRLLPVNIGKLLLELIDVLVVSSGLLTVDQVERASLLAPVQTDISVTLSAACLRSHSSNAGELLLCAPITTMSGLGASAKR